MERLGFKGFGRGVRGEADAGLVSIGRRQRELYLRVYAPICPRGIGIPSMLLVMRGVE